MQYCYFCSRVISVLRCEYNWESENQVHVPPFHDGIIACMFYKIVACMVGSWEPCAPPDAIIILRGPPAVWWSVWLLSLRLTCMVNLLLFLLRSVIKDYQEMTLWTIIVNQLRCDHIYVLIIEIIVSIESFIKLAIKYLIIMLNPKLYLCNWAVILLWSQQGYFCFSFYLLRSSLHNILKGFCSFAL